MALFSQWDWNRNSYKVYATQAPVSIGDDPSPPRPGNLNVLGAVPDMDAKSLPRGASFMGYSQVPRGEIVKSEGKASSRDTYGLGDSEGVSFAAVAGIGFLGLVGIWLYGEVKDRFKR